MTTLFHILTPFSYLDFSGVRLIIFQVSMGALLLIFTLLRARVVYYQLYMIPMALLLIANIIYSVFGGELRSLNSFLACIILMYSAFYIAVDQSEIIGAKYLYIYCCLFFAGGIVIQFLAHLFLGVWLFRSDEFVGGRIAYSFIWSDYSFASLFLVSCLPMIMKNYRNKFILSVLILILIASSVLTSARTGLTAILVSAIIYFSFQLSSNLFRFIISYRLLLLALFVSVVLVLALYFMPMLTGRSFNLDSSGRLDDFAAGLHTFYANPYFGFLLNYSVYNEIVAAVPHNIFIYSLYLGGLFYFVLFIIFLLALVYDIRHADKDLLWSIVICFIGFQFIPSFFSAYFLAILLGIALASSRLNRGSGLMC